MNIVKFHRKRSALCFAVLLALFTLSVFPSCRHSASKSQTAPSETEKPGRLIQPFVVLGDASTETRTFPVVVKEAASAKLSFRVPGKLENFDVTPGRRFKQGEVVAQLERRDYQLVVDRCNQALVEARAALKAMETGARPEDLASAEAGYEAAKSQRETAERQYRRMESLHLDGTASELQFDLAKSTYDSAVAAERAAEKTLEKARKGSRDEEIEMARAKIAGLEIDLQLAENKLNDTTLVAPFSGVATEKFFDNHETVAPGVAILTLIDDKSFEGELNVTEEVALRLSDVVKVECVFGTIPDKVFSATVKEASTSLRKNSRSYLMTISIDATEEDGVLLGMAGIAKITLTEEKPYTLVPISSLVSGADKDANSSSAETNVWIVDQDSLTLTRRVVKVGDTVGDMAQILEGLSEGEMIVGAGARFLTDGQKIRLPENI